MGIIKNIQTEASDTDNENNVSSTGSLRDFTDSGVVEALSDVAIGQGVSKLGLAYGRSTLSKALDDIEDGKFDALGLGYSAAKDVATKAIGGIPGMVAGAVSDVGYGLATDQEGLAARTTSRAGSMVGGLFGSSLGPLGMYAGSFVGG